MSNPPGAGKPERPGTTLQTVERALSVLEFVATSLRPPTVKELSAGLGLKLTTIYHLYNTLEYRGYLRRNADGTLRIGPEAGLLHQALISGASPVRDLHPILADLAASVEETVYLTSWADLSVVIQDVVEGPQTLRVSGQYVGYRGREVQRASGKAVLAHLDQEALDAVVERNMLELDSVIAQKVKTTLPAELRNVRRNGFAVDEQTYTAGVYCVAAPYFGSSGKVAGSISISAPTVRFSKRRTALAGAVIGAARDCSKVLGSLASATG